MSMYYLFTGKSGKGARVNEVRYSASCFGMLSNAYQGLSHSGYTIDPVIYVSTEETRADFDKWFKRLVKDVPSVQFNGVDYKAPKVSYYDGASNRTGNRKEHFGGRHHIRITFDPAAPAGAVYAALKFYFKALTMPTKRTWGGNDYPLTSKTWTRIWQKLESEGIKPTVPMVMWASANESTENTRGYRYPTPSGFISKEKLKAFFLQGLVENTDCQYGEGVQAAARRTPFGLWSQGMHLGTASTTNGPFVAATRRGPGVLEIMSTNPDYNNYVHWIKLVLES